LKLSTKRRSELLAAAAGSLVFTYLFFIEYLPPFKRVHVTHDLEAFHYPLMDYAFQSLRHGRFPEWDPSIYCGMNFAGNLQAGLFYPPHWLLFAANLGRSRLTFQGLEILVFCHVWLAFLLCYVWLRGRRLSPLPVVLGAGVFAYGGYMIVQLQHQGIVSAYAWMPLGLWGLDQAAEGRHWRPLWKTATASAMCFLAGYPSIWLVFSVSVLTYALFGPARWRVTLWAGLALAASMLLASVQLLPAWEAGATKAREPSYGQGVGVRNKSTYLSFFLPNYCDFGMQSNSTVGGACEGAYLYLGAPAFFGLAWLAGAKRLRGQTALLAMAAANLIGLTNPFGVVWAIVKHSELLTQICRDWLFLAGLVLAVPPLAAKGLHDFLERVADAAPRWAAPAVITFLTGWSAWQLYVWLPGSRDFPAGWRSGVGPAVTLAGFALAVHLLRAESGALRSAVAAALLLAVGTEYKVFGTSRRFHTAEGSVDRASAAPPGMDEAVFDELRAHAQYRVALDPTALIPQDLRHYGLTTPQGFDPFIPAQFLAKMRNLATFEDGRLFTLNPADEDVLRELAVRYFITSQHEETRLLPVLLANSSFRQVEPFRGFLRVFEFVRPQLPYRWEEATAGTIQSTRWLPEVREFVVRAEGAGRFVLIEQLLPGWRAAVDGRPVPIQRWRGAFQAIDVPAGEHRIRLEFRAPSLRPGALISAAALALFVLLIRKK